MVSKSTSRSRSQDDWERSTKEMLYVHCPICCLRTEVQLDNTGETAYYLYYLFNEHMVQQHQRPIAFRDYQRLVRTEDVLIHVELDLADILTDGSLRKRVRELARRRGIALESALEEVREQIIEFLRSEGDYRCRSCGKRITRSRARLDGLGVQCRLDAERSRL